ncbi:MAG: DUF6716 putative glycosyltransferase [Porticoccaceae bacterium]
MKNPVSRLLSTVRPKQSKVRCHIDGFNAMTIYGWAVSPEEDLEIGIRVGNKIVAQAPQTKMRPDVVEALHLNHLSNKLGFEIKLNDDSVKILAKHHCQLVVRPISQASALGVYTEPSKAQSQRLNAIIQSRLDENTVDSASFKHYSRGVFSFVVTLNDTAAYKLATEDEQSDPQLWARVNGKLTGLRQYTRIWNYNLPDKPERNEYLYQVDSQVLQGHDTDFYLDSQALIPISIPDKFRNPASQTSASSKNITDGSDKEPASQVKLIALPFHDDSTLIFQANFLSCCRDLPNTFCIPVLVASKEPKISERQLNTYLPSGNYIEVPERSVSLYEFLVENKITSVVAPKPRRTIANLYLARFLHDLYPDLPPIIGFNVGLDFNPVRGIMNRNYYDKIFLMRKSEAGLAAQLYCTEKENNDEQREPCYGPEVYVGHPYLATESGNMGENYWTNLNTRLENIYFFTQSLSPFTLGSRLEVVGLLIEIARRHPETMVHIKLRSLPDEKTVHQERFPYSSLISIYQSSDTPPENLVFSDESFDTVAEKMDLCITCTSTVAVQALAKGIPCIVFLDYLDAAKDPLNAAARELFKDSGLIRDKEALLNLAWAPPEPEWLAEYVVEKEEFQQKLDYALNISANSF